MNTPSKGLIVYQTASGAIELKGDSTKETIWATQVQMAQVFGVTPQSISRHLSNIYAEHELTKGATSTESELVQIEHGRSVKRKVDLYNLDAIISVGYRISSKTGTQFRKWATKTLREHITKGYTINRKRIAKNYDSFMKAVEGVRALAPAGSSVDTKSVLDLVTAFAATWFSLDAYDRGSFGTPKPTKKSVRLAGDELLAGIRELKQVLLDKKEATDLFAAERQAGAVEGIIGNVLQSFAGKELYPSAEEKAAHLLYFMVKNHPFSDGNKRSGAFSFVWFLRKAGLLDVRRLTPEALTALTLLIAESDPKEKPRLIGLVLMLLRQ